MIEQFVPIVPYEGAGGLCIGVLRRQTSLRLPRAFRPSQ